MARPSTPEPAGQAVRSATGVVVCERCVVADSPRVRMRGLLGSEPEPGYGLWLRPANSIHMFFMRFAIDAVFLDRDDRVVRIAHDLAPWRMAFARGSRSVLEVGAGECLRRGIAVGDQLELA
jgi:uncharacterized membrane protein (UPF0127 family)